MSAQAANFANAGKKAVHVKWSGKTIALGTFPSAEADEKCARAKALTRAWRSTMRPKPSRDWVMLELERLGVRVVSGRLGRKAGEEDEEGGGGGGGGGKKPGDVARGPPQVDRNNSMGWATNADLDTLMQRRSSSLGLSLMNDNDMTRRTSVNSLGPGLGLDGNDPAMPPHRPLVGGGAAAAYEAAREFHYSEKREEQKRRASSLGLGIGGGNLGGSGMPQMGLSVNPNQHYEMLKLHHMNLLNEIQETTLMMNLYQQQQLQQQQQQLQQQQATADQGTGSEQQMAMLLQQGNAAGGVDPLFGSGGGLSQRGSLGLGAGVDQQNSQQMQMLRQQQQMMQAAGGSSSVQQDIVKGQQEQAALEEKLQKLKDDIARRQKEAEELESSTKSQGSGGQKRKTEEGDKANPKRSKTGGDDDGD